MHLAFDNAAENVRVRQLNEKVLLHRLTKALIIQLIIGRQPVQCSYSIFLQYIQPQCHFQCIINRIPDAGISEVKMLRQLEQFLNLTYYWVIFLVQPLAALTELFGRKTGRKWQTFTTSRLVTSIYFTTTLSQKLSVVTSSALCYIFLPPAVLGKDHFSLSLLLNSGNHKKMDILRTQQP